MKRESPQYKHDCTACIFLGRFYDKDTDERCDLYVCLGADGKINTVIARLSSKPSDNRAGLGFKRASMVEAEQRALKKGYQYPDWHKT